MGACVQSSRNQKIKIGGQTATHAGVIKASDHLHQRKWEGGRKRSTSSGTGMWKAERNGPLDFRKTTQRALGTAKSQPAL